MLDFFNFNLLAKLFLILSNEAARAVLTATPLVGRLASKSKVEASSSLHQAQCEQCANPNLPLRT